MICYADILIEQTTIKTENLSHSAKIISNVTLNSMCIITKINSCTHRL